MKLKPDINIMAFLREVSTCKGDVYFTTPDGDHLNLKSVLSQYVFGVIAAREELLERGSIICDAREDESLLANYMLQPV